jgi:hypothetical protein
MAQDRVQTLYFVGDLIIFLAHGSAFAIERFVEGDYGDGIYGRCAVSIADLNARVAVYKYSVDLIRFWLCLLPRCRLVSLCDAIQTITSI